MAVPLVETQSGKVQGFEQGSIQIWKGIPFAQPPVGPRRFLPPQPMQPWEGVRETTAFGPMAAQPSSNAMGGFLGGMEDPRPSSEDCLTLNIWSPGADDARRPVMVWIHGGAFVLGSSSDPWYDGTSFATNHNIVVVSMNYRLGLLGFLHLGDVLGAEYAHSGNNGLLDQIVALQWVRDNIAAFGGDPNNVTIMGESAGAMSVGTLLGMPAAKGLFRRAILESGAGSNVRPLSGANRITQAVLDHLNLDAAHASALIDVPLEDLFTVQNQLAAQLGGVGAYGPVIDGGSLPLHPLAMITQGSATDVEILIGTNRDEWRLFVLMAGGAMNTRESELERLFGSRGQQALDTYINARADKSSHLAWVDITTDSIFRIPAVRLAEAQVKQGAPVWMYRFDWATQLFGGQLGACHALEIPFVWNTLNTDIARMFTGDAQNVQGLADCMHAVWAAFIRDGNPNTILPQRPRYDLEQRATLIFNAESQHVEQDPQGQERQLWEKAQ